MNGRVTENSASGKKSRIKDEQKCNDGKKVNREQRMSFVIINYHDMRSSNKSNPRNERSIFHRVPCPESSEAQRFIRPGSAHQNSGTENHHRKKSPRHYRLYPF